MYAAFVQQCVRHMFDIWPLLPKREGARGPLPFSLVPTSMHPPIYTSSHTHSEHTYVDTFMLNINHYNNICVTHA
jgi:hypothetical protein